jgi:three-Cys-motif partner protein
MTDTLGLASFFEKPKDQSQVKAQIVSKYFWAWAKVIMPSAKRSHGRIAYVDLFAGPGRYADGTESTPILVLERAVQDPDMREMLVAIFNDVDPNNTRSLQIAIKAIPNVETLKHEPQVFNEEVGEEIARIFEQILSVPTLFFVDPWGYKGLSLQLIGSLLQGWGRDCIFFFNYNRINMGLRNPKVEEHMNDLFGQARADKLREELEGLSPSEGELAIVKAIAQGLKAVGGQYVQPFRFKDAHRTSHHLIFVTKHIRGYEIMKDIMAKESSSREQGVPSFEYNPATRQQPLLFELSRPLDDLADIYRPHVKTSINRTLRFQTSPSSAWPVLPRNPGDDPTLGLSHPQTLRRSDDSPPTPCPSENPTAAQSD